jgi:lipopolysaccharide biosynthesis glycosyltransferase
VKKLIVQLNIEPELDHEHVIKGYTWLYKNDLYETSNNFAKLYSLRCNADYYLIKNKNDWLPGQGKHIAYQKLKFYDFKDNYDVILFLDSDYIIKTNAPNVFDLYKNQNCVVKDNGNAVSKLSKNLQIPASKYFNSGFMLLTSNFLKTTEQHVLTEYIHKDWKLADQGLLNRLMYEHQVQLTYLDDKLWNDPINIFAEYSDHYGGSHKLIFNKELYNN